MKKLKFTENNIWIGGNFEITMLFQNKNELEICNAIKEVWRNTVTPNPYLKSDIEPEEQLPFNIDDEFDLKTNSGNFFGLIELPNKEITNCTSFIFNPGAEKHFLYFGFPLGGLGRFYEIGGYPFGEVQIKNNWLNLISDLLGGVGKEVFSKVKFDGAIIGFELLQDELLEKAIKNGGPNENERYDGYLIPQDDKLKYFEPNTLRAPFGF